MNTHIWTQYFIKNRNRFTEPDMPLNSSGLPDSVRLPLVRSLAIFQLGESGGGTRLMHYVRRVVNSEQLAGYEHSVGLFIEEEQYHSRLLARLVNYLGAECLTKQWTNSIFRWLRNHFGVEFNIQVLLIAELIAEAYFGSLYRKSCDKALRTCCHKILSDEMRHIAFHAEFLRERLEGNPLWRADALARTVQIDSSRHLRGRGVGSSQVFPGHRLEACGVRAHGAQGGGAIPSSVGEAPHSLDGSACHGGNAGLTKTCRWSGIHSNLFCAWDISTKFHRHTTLMI